MPLPLGFIRLLPCGLGKARPIFPHTKKDRLVSGLFFYPFYPFCQSKKPSPM